MKKIWLFFTQVITIVLAIYFVVQTLHPEWIKTNQQGPSPTISVFQAAANTNNSVPIGSFRDAAQKAAAAVVSISTSQTKNLAPRSADPWFQFFGEEQDNESVKNGIGSGVIVSPQGYILTNNHVVEGADGIEVTLNDGRHVQATVIGTDPETDVAVLKINLDKLPTITLGSSDSARVGDQVLAIGNPFGVGQTVTSGIVSAMGRNQLGINTFENFIQTDAAINPGNSGGALVDVNGNLLGINTAIYSRSGGNMGIGFAIPVNIAQQVMNGLIKDGKITRGWIGVEPQDINPEIANLFKLNNDVGVVITAVQKGAPAYTAGIKPGDVVKKIEGKEIKNVSDLLQVITSIQPSNVAVFELERQGNPVTLKVIVGTRPKQKSR